ncbi:MAG: hypothetical protein COW24_05575 [Candidatus Kerfeldbacteria bacterium CG15_BIG_FIL_POST_REV_8_21_14_020_45_12]|uniref:Cell surface protein n=1 Tax=Candidatus Kerfeldbacteria bacterium CG15_BIG_FIL_POST_REV_8_21_14_020_45_12 TaxID=2014247 RepID=A0A2M7H2E6_9BACT|nr:MAG: hypothetical protein COW24_05575 [Candidatus Kerfeldbacteria bacterium CG15_BIG_FIL_POST_REV_8_21_14_020_45_12]PJA93910.1 MAG: hypothetical protein CO132_00985 [Candidatus Kerfeldbacteria bacterium CG_4_9_14_3_um_filter_45_8]
MSTKTRTINITFLVVLTLSFLGFTGKVEAAWNVPSCNPDTVGPTDPSCNVAAPLNVANSAQSKSGALTIQNTLSAAELQVDSTYGGSGTVRITAASGDALSVTQNSTTARGFYLNINSNSPAQEIDQNGTGPGIDIDSSAGTGILVSGSADGINATGGSHGGSFTTTTGSSGLVAEHKGGQDAIRAISGADPSSFALPGTLAAYGADAVRAGSDIGYGVVAVTHGSANSSSILGYSDNAYGVFGYSKNKEGVYGNSDSTTTAYGGYFCNQFTRCAGLGGPVYAGYFNNLVSIQTNSGNASLSVKNSSISTAGRAVVGHTGTASLTALSVALPIGVSGQAYQGYGVLAYSQGATGLYSEGTIGAEIKGSSEGAEIKSSAGGTGLIVKTDTAGLGASISTDQGGTGLQVKTSNSGTTIGTGISVTVDAFANALETNSGHIHNIGAYNGGVIYPNENAGGGLHPNVEVRQSHKISLPNIIGGAENIKPNAIEFDGSDVWVVGSSSTGSGALYRIDVATSRIVESYKLATNEGPTNAKELLHVESDIWHDVIFVFGDNANYQAVPLYDDKSKITAAASTGATGTVNGAVFDGNSIWLATTTGVYDWDFEGAKTSVSAITGINSHDVIFADSYIWASDFANKKVLKIDPTSRAVVATITVGSGPRGLAYDGQYVWVANSTDNSISRINTSNSNIQTVSVSPLGSTPRFLVFDGAKLWITFQNNLVGNFDVSSMTAGKTVSVGNSPQDIAFDGTNVWSANSGSADVSKVPTGTGFGVNPGAYQTGLLIAGQNDVLYCLYVDSTGAFKQSSTLSNCGY